MAVSSETNKRVYLCDGSSTTFAYPFKIFEEGDLKVSLFTIADSTETVLRLSIDYTVTGEGEDAGGEIELIIEVDGDSIFTEAPSSDYKIVLLRELDFTQPVDYAASGPFPAETHEQALDRLTYLIQQVNEKVNRCFIRDITQDGLIVTDLDATWYILTQIDLSSATLSNNLDLKGYSITNILSVRDADLDTYITFEKTADEDKLRFYTAGIQRALIDSDGLTLASGASVNEFSIDGTLGGNSDDAVPTEKAVKTYVDTLETYVNSVEYKVKADSGDSSPGYLGDKVDNSTVEVSVTDKLQVKDSGISQAKLKTSTGEVSQLVGGYTLLELTGGSYIFYPEVKCIDGSGGDTASAWFGAGGSAGDVFTVVAWNSISSSYISTVLLGTSGSADIYAQNRYISASGRDHWIFLLVAKKVIVDKYGKPICQKGEVISSSQAPDHPCYCSGNDEIETPHPFRSYNPELHEVVVVDNKILNQLKPMITRKNTLLTLINKRCIIDDTKRPQYEPREIIEIDEWGDLKGDVIKVMKTPDWAKIKVARDEIEIKRRMIEKLPDFILYKEMVLKQ